MKLHTIRFLSLLLLSSLPLTACQSQKDSTDGGMKREQTLRLTESAEIPTMDPSKASDAISFRIMTNTMEGLYRLDGNSQPSTGIAKSYIISPDQRTYTFTLRDAKWSNGDAVTAQDFVYAWRRLVSPQTGAKHAYTMYYIKNAQAVHEGRLPPEQLGVRVQDPKTLIVDLEAPLPVQRFLTLTALPSYFPLHEEFTTKQGDKFGMEAATVLYNGPFTLSEWKHNKSFTLAKHTQYWDAKAVKLEEIRFRIIKDVQAAVKLYKDKEIDQVGLTSDIAGKYKQNKQLQMKPEAALFFLRMNQKIPILQNLKARQAIHLAIDKKEIVNKALQNGSKPAYFAVPKGFVKGPACQDFRAANGNMSVTDTKQAKQLWKEAQQETRQKTITLELLCTDTETAKHVCSLLEKQLEKQLSGLTVKTVPQAFEQSRLAINNGSYQLALDGWSADYIDAVSFLDLFVTGGPNNNMSYSNTEYDRLISEAKINLAMNEKARFANLAQAERMLMNEAVIAPLYQRGRALLTRPYVKGISYPIVGGDSYKKAYLK